MFESSVSIFSKFNFVATLLHQEEDVEDEEEEEERRDTCQAKKVMQRDGKISTSFHSLWICVAMLLHMVSETMVEAACAPTILSTAVNACLSESGTGNCPNFAAASNGAGCNNGGVNGVIGDWDVSQVTSLDMVFFDKGSFNADISKWDTSSVTTMYKSTSLSFSSSFLTHLYLILIMNLIINQIVLLTFFFLITFIFLFLLYSIWGCLCVQR